MTAIISNPLERTRFLKFMAVGAFGAFVDFGIANVLAKYLLMPLVYAGTISFTCAIISNFIWNRYWTYPESRSRALHLQLGMFFLVNVAGLAIRLPILRFVEPVLLRVFTGWWEQGLSRPMPVTPEFAARNITLALAVGIVMLWNFFVNRYWTYNDVSS